MISFLGGLFLFGHWSQNIHSTLDCLTAITKLVCITDLMSFLVCSYILSFILICQRPVVFGKTCGSCTRMTFSVKDVLNDRALEDNRRLKDTIVEHDSQCFTQCSHNCQCLSFNICGKTCQLNAANKFLAKNSLRVKPGCRYYDFPISEVRLTALNRIVLIDLNERDQCRFHLLKRYKANRLVSAVWKS